MVRNYIRKTDRQKWSADDMSAAIKAVKSKAMGYKKAALTYNVPQSTLEDRVRKMSDEMTPEQAATKGMGRFHMVFSEEQENELVSYVKDMESRLFGLTTKELRRVAYQLAEKNQCQHNFNATYKIAGLGWLEGFMKRHPNLSLRSPEPTSAARAMGFNPVVVGQFFELLGGLKEKHNFEPADIYKVDETGLTTVPKRESKIVAMRDRRQVGTLTSAERGQLVTAVLCFSAAGHFVPPLLIFPRVRMKNELCDGAPPGTKFVCHPSGWMQTDIFVHWMEHFIKYAKPTKEKPILLLLEGPATHTKNIELIDLARQHGVVLLCFPPHCTHKLQPLDVSFMGPLSTFYSQETKSWLRENPIRVVTQYQISRLFGRAYNRAATMQTALSGFRKTGIFPLQPNIFEEHDFIAAQTTDNADVYIAPEENPSNTSERETNEVDEITQGGAICDSPLLAPTITSTPVPFDVQNSPQPSTSTADSSFTVRPTDIMPIPSAPRKKTNARRKGKTAVLTDSPYKNELEALQTGKAKTVKRKVFEKNPTKRGSKVVKKTERKAETESEDDSEDEGDARGCYFKEKYSATKKADGWIQCAQCPNWAHEGCTKLPDSDLEFFTCNKC